MGMSLQPLRSTVYLFRRFVRAVARRLRLSCPRSVADDQRTKELDSFRYAFETTAQDRDRIQQERDCLLSIVTKLIAEPVLLDNFAKHSRTLPPPPRPLDDALATIPGVSPMSNESEADYYLPNVYCVGAPKSCTSFFYSILRQHPSIFVGEKDNTNISRVLSASRQLDKQRLASELATFAQRANKGYENQSVFCNFEVGFYIYPRGSQLIASHLDPDARVMIFLRDPIKRMVSEYVMRTRQFDKRRNSFIEAEEFFNALDLEKARCSEDFIRYSMFYAYIKMSDYADLIEPYIASFGTANVKVVIMELDVVENLEATVLDCFAFLGLKDVDAVKIAFTDHGRYAEMSRMPTEISVRFICSDGSNHVDPVDIAPLLGIGLERIEIRSDVPQQLDLVIETPSEADAKAAATLAARHGITLTVEQERRLYDAHFRDGVSRLEKLIGRDLSCWYRRYELPGAGVKS